jgi:hypothetical protein
MRRRRAWWPAHSAAAAGWTSGRCACTAVCVCEGGGGLHHWPGALSFTSLAQHQPATQPATQPPTHTATQPPSLASQPATQPATQPPTHTATQPPRPA